MTMTTLRRAASLLRARPTILLFVSMLLGFASLGQAAPRLCPLKASQDAPVAGEGTAEEGADPGAVLYRAGEIKAAEELWNSALEAGQESRAERARLAYNLGVAAQSQDDPLDATCWYEASLRLRPRMEEASHNLDLARADAGLAPAHGDGMTAAAGRFASRLTRGEAEWLALAGAVLFALAALLEALWGAPARKGVWAAVLLQPFFFCPLLWHVANGADNLHMVINPGTTAVYPQPDFVGERVGLLEPGDEVAVVDELPGWSKVEIDGQGRWVESHKLRRLDW